MIKIFIPSWRRPDTMTTPALLGGLPYKVVVRANEYPAYARTVGRSHLMVVGDNDGLNVVRERIRKTLKKGEWSLHMDDNVQGFIQCDRQFYNTNDEVPTLPGERMITRDKWQHWMNVPATFEQFYALAVEDTLREAGLRDVYLCGFSAHENPAFRARKFSAVGYVCGKTMLMRNVGLPWNQSEESSGEDYALTAAHLYDDGAVLINKWGHPLRKHYMPGGCGPYEERLPAMLRAQAELCRRYGALFGIKNANDPDKKQGELRIRFHTVEQVAKWRAALPMDPNWRVKK